jgi:hypothetical protein
VQQDGRIFQRAFNLARVLQIKNPAFKAQFSRQLLDFGRIPPRQNRA